MKAADWAKEMAAAAAGRDDPLLNWARPEREECILCMHPLPLDADALFTYWNCCGKTTCSGCLYDQVKVDVQDGRFTLETLNCWSEYSRLRICPFCRTDNVKAGDDTLAKK